MSAKAVQNVWSASNHPWSSWVKRPLFASLSGKEVVQAKEGDVYRSELAPWVGKAPSWLSGERVAVLIDLPGRDAIEMGLALGSHGFRPVLSINATSSREEAIDMHSVLDMLAEGARFASSFPSGSDVLPAFILDSRREGAGTNLAPGRFDNRWTVFPTDLPSAEHLKKANIASVVIIQEGTDVKADVQAIAWTYQRGGLEVRVANLREHTTVSLPKEQPGWFSFMMGQFRRRFALRRRWDGSYGHRVPIPPEPSHG